MEQDGDARMSGTLTWGVLGTGMVARRAMLPALSRVVSARVLAVGSASQERAADRAAQFAVPRAYGSYQEVLDDPEIAAVYVALPNHLHREWVLRAARAGKHVLCEKPLGCSASEVEEMARGCAAADVLLMEALMYRFHPRTERLRTLLAGGIIGEIRHVSTAFTFPLANWNGYRARPELGGGALLDVGGYCISAVRMVMDGDPVNVEASAQYGETGIDESVTALLTFSGGRTTAVVCSFRAAEYQRITVIGATGVLEVPLAFTAWHSDPAPILIQRGGTVETLTIESADPYQLMAERFTEAALLGVEAPYPLAETLATARIMDAIRRAT